MHLSKNGIDIIYVDESGRYPRFTASAVRVPFLRPTPHGWRFVWNRFHDAADRWRRSLSKSHNVLFRKELHAYEILKPSGLYLKSHTNFSPTQAVDFYRTALSTITFLPHDSIFVSFGTDQSRIAGADGIEATMLGLFQRLRMQCITNRVNALLFFDEGHEEYVRWFRRSQVYLPTGSAFGGWGAGRKARNLPLLMFPKDANFKKSHLSYFIQIADLVAYAARLKIEFEQNALAAKRVRRNHHTLYDSTPNKVINFKATSKRNDGIVPV